MQLPTLGKQDEGYFMEPSLSELQAMEEAEPGAACRVRDFIVGRKGYGFVRFLGETDVSRLGEITEIVSFERCEIQVYMDEEGKPEVGEGLNKEAEVTLMQVFCVDKATGKTVRHNRPRWHWGSGSFV